MDEIFEDVYGTSWKLRRRIWIRKGEEVELYLPKPSEMIYMIKLPAQVWECNRATSSLT